MIILLTFLKYHVAKSMVRRGRSTTRGPKLVPEVTPGTNVVPGVFMILEKTPGNK
mgnify:CR=1 FL=1